MELVTVSLLLGDTVTDSVDAKLNLRGSQVARLVEAQYSVNLLGITAGALQALYVALSLDHSIIGETPLSTGDWLADPRLFGRAAWTQIAGAAAETVGYANPIIVPLHGLEVGDQLFMQGHSQWDATAMVVLELYFERVVRAQAIRNRMHRETRP